MTELRSLDGDRPPDFIPDRDEVRTMRLTLQALGFTTEDAMLAAAIEYLYLHGWGPSESQMAAVAARLGEATEAWAARRDALEARFPQLPAFVRRLARDVKRGADERQQKAAALVRPH